MSPFIARSLHDARSLLGLCLAWAFALPVAAESPRSLTSLQADLRDALRREAVAASDALWCESIERLCDLFTEIRGDARLDETPLLQKAAARLRVRLRQTAEELQRQSALEQGEAPSTAPSAEAEGEVFSADALPPPGDAEDSELLRAGLPDASDGQDRPPQGGRTPTPEDARREQRRARLAARALADHLEVAGGASGGVAPYWTVHGGATSSGAPGGGAWGDFAPALIELIQSTIEPEHWDVAGGPATIRYYRPVFALVVRASSHVHPQVGGILGKLRD